MLTNWSDVGEKTVSVFMEFYVSTNLKSNWAIMTNSLTTSISVTPRTILGVHIGTLTYGPTFISFLCNYENLAIIWMANSIWMAK